MRSWTGSLLSLTISATLASGCQSDKLPVDSADPGGLTSSDADSDGYASEEDCDDADSSINPGAVEICDGVDNNCDGIVDEDVTTVFFEDADGDGFGDSDRVIEACDAPAGYAAVGNDCDDSSADSHPGAAERCDDEDNDCDGTVDEDVRTEWYADADSDGYGDPDSADEVCDPPPGYVENADDCDDTDDTSFPGGVEVCDEADNDCDGTVDEGVTTTYYQDIDGDGFGVPDVTTEACSTRTGYAAEAGDCDDTDRTISPSAAELCDSVDNDCDGDIDEDSAADAATWYADDDGDGYGDEDDSTVSCTAPSGYVADRTDCDDTSSAASPATAEVCDGVDNDCDTEVDEDSATDAARWYADGDGDGYGDGVSTVACNQPSGFVDNADDCDDSDKTSSPAGTEVCDEADNDCDGTTDEGVTTTFYADDDGDGQGNPDVTAEACTAPSGYVTRATDCDDTDARISPNAAEVCDSVDNDCDGDIDEDDAVDAATFYLDGDGDGYGLSSTTVEGCSAPSGYAALGGDCDDSSGSYSPGATAGCDGEDYDCDGIVDSDLDGDGYADAACGGDDCDDSDAGLVTCESCNDWFSTGASTDGIYDIDPGATGASYDVYCDMTRDGGGWTLVFTSTANSTTYGSGWDYWWKSGGTTTLTSTTGDGKSEAYDDLTFGEIRLTATYGTSTIYASTGSTYTGLPVLVGSEITTCSGLQGVPRHKFTSSSRSGSYWQNDYIALVACDTDGTSLESSGGHYDAAIFSTVLNQGDYSAYDGALGSEYRLGGGSSSSGSSSSNRLSVWLR